MNYYESVEEWEGSTDDVLVVVNDNVGGEWFCGFENMPIVQSAETACARVWIDHGLKCSSFEAIVEWSDGTIFGPFDVSIGVSATVENPRQGDLE